MEGAAKEVSRGPMAMGDLLAKVCGPAATIYKTGVNMYNRFKLMNSSETQSQEQDKIQMVGSSPANTQLGSKKISPASQVFLQVHI